MGISGTAALYHIIRIKGMPKLGTIGAIGASPQVVIVGNNFNAFIYLKIRIDNSKFEDNSIRRLRRSQDLMQSFS